ncbi:hypothetical protein Tco_1006123, partial [Tanacetum coccineum]
MAFGGNTRNLSSFGEETDEITDLHQIHKEILFSERGDGVTGIKRCRRDPSSDGVRDLVTASGRGRLIEDLESSTYGYSSIGRFDVFFRNQLLVFQQHQDESLYDSWTRFKYVIRKVLNHGLSIWTLIEIFLKHLDSLSRHIINLIAEGDLRKFSDIEAWDDMIRVQVPRCMAWQDYDEYVDSNEVGVTSPESTTQTLSSFEEYTPPMTYPEEVEKTLGTSIEVEPSNETKLEEV